jgi:dTDP-4-amino-4,6-dideoxygalactose transaminase
MGSNEEFLIFGRPGIGEEEIAEVEACLRSGWLGTGPRVARFEENFAEYKGVDSSRVAALNSCTAALQVSMIAADLEKGDEVITSPLTFCATVNAIIHAGLTPVLADIDPVTQCISPEAIEAAISPRTRAILPVHFAGRPCDMSRIMKIARKHDLIVIEDCAHAIETQFQGEPVGRFGDFGCFSFYVTKNVVTGEGGMIVGKSSEHIARAKVLALHGMTKDAWHRFGDSGYRHYQVVECGFKFNMMDIQAAMGIHQLARVEANWEIRRNVWGRYQHELKNLPLALPAEPDDGDRHAYHLFTVLIDEAKCGLSRDVFLDKMNELRVGTGVHYLSIPEHPYYQQEYGWRPEQWPNAMRIGRQTVSLPLSARLSDSDVSRVLGSVHQILELTKSA